MHHKPPSQASNMALVIYTGRDKAMVETWKCGYAFYQEVVESHALETSLADECLNFCNHSGKVTIITA